MEKKFKFQTTKSDRAVGISEYHISYKPIIVNTCLEYEKNQPKNITYDAFSPVTDGVNTWIESTDITSDNILITDKLSNSRSELWYQYQPKYDVHKPEYIIVKDLEGNNLEYVVEYAYISGTSDGINYTENLPINTDTSIDFDELNSFTEFGDVQETTTYTQLDILGNRPMYRDYGSVLYDGLIFYSGQIADEGCFDIDFFVNDNSLCSGVFISGSNWDVTMEEYSLAQLNIYNSGIDFVTDIPINNDKWNTLRLCYDSDQTNIYLQSDNLQTYSASGIIDPSGWFYLMPHKGVFLSNLTLWDEDALDLVQGKPLITNRYNTILNWDSYKIEIDTNDLYRIRLLFPVDTPAEISYNTIISDNIVSKKEIINYIPKYSKLYSNIIGDWYYSDNKVYFIDSQLQNASYIYVKNNEEKQLELSVDNKYQIHVNLADFQEGSYRYYIPEYNYMISEADKEHSIDPKKVMVSCSPADIIDRNTIQISPFTIYVGNKNTDYTIENTQDTLKEIAADGSITTTGDITPKTYRNTRGINIYINKKIIPNEYITDYDMKTGIIKLNININFSDNVEVTYLQNMDSYLCKYPQLNPLLTDDKWYRFYIRPWWASIDTEYPGDRAERVAYKKLDSNGTPIGALTSCWTDLEVIDLSGTLEIGDVFLKSEIEYIDIRNEGGGLKDDSFFGENSTKREEQHPMSPGYLDIGTVDGIPLF